MPAMLKTALKIGGVLFVLGIAVVIGLIYTFDVNQYKPQIESAALDATGLELDIAGDIDLNFRPYFGIALNDVRIKNPNFPQELASSSAISLRVDVGQLLDGQLAIEEFNSDDFHINLITNAEGESIWETEVLSASSGAELEERQENTGNLGAAEGADDSSAFQVGSNISVEVKRFRIANASVDIQDQSTGSSYRIENLDITSTDSNIEGRAFPLKTRFSFINGIEDPLDIALNTVPRVNLDEGSISIEDIELSLTPMLLTGEVNVEDINNEPTLSARFQSNSFGIFDLLDSLGMGAATAGLAKSTDAAPGINSDPAQQFQISLDISGDSAGLDLNSLTATLGETRFNMDADVRFADDFQPMNLRYNLASNAIDLTSFMGGEETAAGNSDAVPAAAGEAAELPFAMLNDYNVTGAIALESFQAGDLQLGAINLFTNLENGVLDIETQPIAAYGGNIRGNMRINARGDAATIETASSISGLNVVELALSIPDLQSVQGRLNVENNFTTRGNTVDALIENLNGMSTFAISENSVDISVIKQVFTAIAALSPNGDSMEQWPDVIQFSSLSGFVEFEEGIEAGQQINLSMDNFDMSGTGGLNLAASTFDYDFEFTILGPPAQQTIQINQLYHDVSWPVQCEAAFADSPSQYCSPDFTQVSQIFAQMATNEVRRRVQEELTDRVPEDLQESARGLLRGLLNN